MSTLEATVSMLETMPEEVRYKAYEYTQTLLAAESSKNPFVAVSDRQVLSDLAESRRQIADGEGLNMRNELQNIDKKYGFV